MRVKCNIRETLTRRPKVLSSVTRLVISMLHHYFSISSNNNNNNNWNNNKEHLSIYATMLEELWDTAIPLVMYHSYPLMCCHCLPILHQIFDSGAVPTSYVTHISRLIVNTSFRDSSHVRLFPLMQSIEKYESTARERFYGESGVASTSPDCPVHELSNLMDRLVALEIMPQDQQFPLLLKLDCVIDFFGAEKGEEGKTKQKRLSVKEFLGIIDRLPESIKDVSAMLSELCELLHSCIHEPLSR